MNNFYTIITLTAALALCNTSFASQDSLACLNSNLTSLQEAAKTKKIVTPEYVIYKQDDIIITVLVDNITKLSSVDAIVNAANAQLTWGGGVCGAIFNAAGQEKLEEEVEKALAGRTEIAVGEALVTPIPVSTADLPTINNPEQDVRFVVHAVGPNCNIPKENRNRKKLLTNAYANSILAADKVGVKSIAFPAISTAIFACPMSEAAPIAINTTLETLKKTNVKHALFVFLNTTSDGFNRYIKLLDKAFNIT